MSASAYVPQSYVPVQKWEDRAEQLLKDPEAFYAAVPTRKTVTVKVWGAPKGRKSRFKWWVKR